MESQTLSEAAEKVRQGIVDMIPEITTLSNQPADTLATLLEEDEDGIKSYGGDLLAGQIHQLISEMKIGSVCLQLNQLIYGVIELTPYLGLEMAPQILAEAFRASQSSETRVYFTFIGGDSYIPTETIITRRRRYTRRLICFRTN